MNKISGTIMILAGGFIVWYWATILRSGAAALGDNGLVRFVDRLSASLTTTISDHPLTVALIVLGVITLPVLAIHARRRRTEKEPEPETIRS
jgi:hypothetical protein